MKVKWHVSTIWVGLISMGLLVACGDDKSEETGDTESDSGEVVEKGPRTTTLLNEGWLFNLGDEDDVSDPDFDDADWDEVMIPHDWSIYLDFDPDSPADSSAGYLDGGVGWYRKTFTVDESEGRQFFLRFDGVYMNSEVWINGEALGERPYGYIWFEYDVTPYLNADGEENTIAVRVNNEQPNSRWYSGSGIYRNVWLTETAPVHMVYDGFSVQTPTIEDDAAEVETAVEVANDGDDAATVTLSISIEDSSG